MGPSFSGDLRKVCLCTVFLGADTVGKQPALGLDQKYQKGALVLVKDKKT